MRLLCVLAPLVLAVGIRAAPATPQNSKKWPNSNSDQKNQKPDNTLDESPEQSDVVAHNTQTPTIKNNSTTTTNSSTPAVNCSSFVTAIASSGLKQDCTVHDNCLGACCTTTLLAHVMTYNFSVKPCDKPSVDLDFNITDIPGADIRNVYNKSDSVTIPKGNMSYAGIYETESSMDIVLEKVLDVTHFRLDFGVHYRVLKSDALQSLFTHTLVPMLTVEFSKELCVKPTEPPKVTLPKVTLPKKEGDMEDDTKYFGVIPKEYMEDKTKLALVGTSVALGVVILIGLIFFIIAKKRAEGHFYRTYVSTDENRHLTKGNDGFEPLDDSDID